MTSPWLKFLENDNEDIYSQFRHSLNLKCTELVSETVKNYKEAYPDISPEDANKFALILVMEQMLSLQHEYAPDSQKAMAMALFVELPSLAEERIKFVEDIFNINQMHQDKITQKMK